MPAFPTKRLICGHQFVLVTTIELDRDESGRIREFSPKGQDGRDLSDAPFCRFSFPTNRHTAGVYAVAVNDRVVYVGKTNNLSRRWGPDEYGDIRLPDSDNPQVTNRRVNHGILDAARRGDSVQVWFHQTVDRDTVENALIERLDLLWNRQGPTTSAPLAPKASPPARVAWSSVIREAEAAKSTLCSDRARGEQMFAELVAAYPKDGMVYLKRAEAYEQCGDRAAAAVDFARAEALLPFPGRKAEARSGLRRVRGAD